MASIISFLLVVMFAFACYAIYLNLTPELQAQEEDDEGNPDSPFFLIPLDWGLTPSDNNCGEHHDCGCSICIAARNG